MLERIKLLLNISDEDNLINELIALTKSKVLSYIGEKDIPSELEFIVIELTVSRYNRIGSEGLKSESVDGRVQSYESDLESYYTVLDKYIEGKQQVRKVRLI